MKILINTCYGGFSLSEAAMHRTAELKGLDLYMEGGFAPLYWLVPEGLREDQADFRSMSTDERQASNERIRSQLLDCRHINRADPHYVQSVEELGKAADGKFAQLKVVEIPDGVDFEIKDYAGIEHIAEVHRTWS